MNQEKDAHATPVINGVSCPAANVTWKAPSIIVPSMIACGLNQVTTQADEILFQILCLCTQQADADINNDQTSHT